MQETSDVTQPSWRDHADKLSDEQVAEFAAREQRYMESGGAEDARVSLLNILEEDLLEAEIQRKNAHVPPPAGAIQVDEWSWASEKPDLRFVRYFDENVVGVNVQVEAEQFEDGSVHNASVEVFHGPGVDPCQWLTPDDALKLASMIIDAAGIAERVRSPRVVRRDEDSVRHAAEIREGL